MTYAEELAGFRRAREDSLTREDGWLAQVALAWLGGDGVELEIGRFTAVDGGVRFVAAPGVDVRRDGAPTTTVVLDTAADDSPDVLLAGTRRYQIVRRGGALAVRVRDAAAPARTAFRGLSWYPPKPAWRIVGRLEPAAAGERVVAYTGGQHGPGVVPGAVVFDIAGVEHRLTPYAEPDGSLLIVFRDATNADATCAMCRYFYALPPDAEHRVVLDFNRAASPICAFVPEVTCVLPPPENTLPLRVEAGERRYG